MVFFGTLAAALEFIKTNKEQLTFVGGALGALIALQRYRADQAWKKKQSAFDFGDKMFADHRVMAALRMLDWENGFLSDELIKEFGLKVEDREWTSDAVALALRAHDGDNHANRARQGQFTLKEYAIRSVFDTCLAHLDRLGHFLRTGVISLSDVPAAVAYYPLLTEEERCHARLAALQGYMRRYSYSDAQYLFQQVIRVYRKRWWQRPAIRCQMLIDRVRGQAEVW